ncbi:hypothetical protein ACJJIX_15510 [Microbulbifer sp. VAAC004]|uniref:Uncharacterized protein n=1 Tax=Microbulbifer variabilis TaxID=266805 RepID=A0ABY4VFM1_9GAMM|nr:hypothetical protein [Microbulbifer variabilis]USD23104.1 hypothetical protein MJO52_08205 [Microbulbifer variabilis]
MKANKEDWRAITFAFYSLVHNDLRDWEKLPDELKNSDMGGLCQKYIDTKDIRYLIEAGEMLAGKNWYTALGRTF